MYLDFARELRKLWNLRMIPTVVFALGMVHKGLEKD